MKIEKVTHNHLRKLFDDNYECIINHKPIPDEDLELIAYELIYSLLICPYRILDNGYFPILIDDKDGKHSLPLFTDLAEFEKEFHALDDVHPFVDNFNSYLQLGIERIVINPGSEKLAFYSDSLKEASDIPIFKHEVTNESLDVGELRELVDSHESQIDLSKVYDYEWFFSKLSDALFFVNVKLDGAFQNSDETIRLEKIPVYVNIEGYLELYTSKEEIKKEGGKFASIAVLDSYIDYLIRMDYNGIIINPASEKIVVERNVLLKNFENFRNNYDSSKFAKAMEYAFEI